jgi:PAS domain S-box-containing protein
LTALRQSELRLRLIADALPVLISYIDTTSRYQFNNATYERWFGIPAAECQGRHVREVVGAAVYGLVKDRIAAALRGEPQSFEARLTYPAGGPARDVRVEYVPHRGPDGRCDGGVE